MDNPYNTTTNMHEKQMIMASASVNVKEWLDTQPDAFATDQAFLDSLKVLERKVQEEAFRSLGVALPDVEWEQLDNPYAEDADGKVVDIAG